jgi:hypothetical protein
MDPERVFALMFLAASQTVLLLSRDKKRLGSTPAMTTVLNTWTPERTFPPRAAEQPEVCRLSDEDSQRQIQWYQSQMQL